MPKPAGRSAKSTSDARPPRRIRALRPPAAPPSTRGAGPVARGLSLALARAVRFFLGMISYAAPDLTRHPPRSPRAKLGGLVHLPRLLDKARAHAAGKIGDYKWHCPLDQRLCTFLGLDVEALLAEVKKGRSDTEMLAWVMANSKHPRTAWEIRAWSEWLNHLAAGSADRHQMFADELKGHSPARDDIVTYFDRLDLDDYVSFGGRS